MVSVTSVSPLTRPLDCPPLTRPLHCPPLTRPLHCPPLTRPLHCPPLTRPLHCPPLTRPLHCPPLTRPLHCPPLTRPLHCPPLMCLKIMIVFICKVPYAISAKMSAQRRIKYIVTHTYLKIFIISLNLRVKTKCEMMINR